ncbi:head maturation protease, ClpP-related [Enterococcus gallinarum]|uniref:head maturation protease, ClpP-related n=1 Tax=Enterococcus gallinarum TaxID=1353 RepID=UPI002890660F|nr:head maturation protease, ClpP-related [Enterococcus gallinarum]MDT2685812.1 ATP-dependent Clp protease proteolytic subunit [Enterococcus gallinarum]
MINLRLAGVVGYDITASAISEFLNTNDDQDITIYLNSPGGYVIEGLEIYNLLRASGRNITTVLTGMAASMGSILFLAGDKRIAMTGTLYMIHKPSGIAWGDADDFRKEADLLDKMQGNLQKIYEERANIENLETLINQETWMDVDEMKKFGVVNSDEKVSFDGISNNDENQQAQIGLESEEDMTIEELKAQKAQLEEQLEEARLEKEVREMQAELDSIKAQTSPVVKPEEPQEQITDQKDSPADSQSQESEQELESINEKPSPEQVEDVIDTTNTVASKTVTNKIPAFMQVESKY